MTQHGTTLPESNVLLHQLCARNFFHCRATSGNTWHFLGDRKKVQTFSWGASAPDPPPQVGGCRGLQGCAMAKGCSDLVNGLECRLQNIQVSSNQACRFWNFFLGPIPDFFLFFVKFPRNAKNNVDPADPTLFLAFPGNA